MPFEKLHFLYHKDKKDNGLTASFAAKMMAELGQAPIDEADAVISIGGDGLLLQALKDANGKPVYPITPPGSDSCGFWTNHDIADAAALKEHLARAETVPLQPLKAEIKFTDGTSTIRHAFNDVAIERASGQSVIINLSAQFAAAAAGPLRIMGDGFIFSTALGSTGTNRSYGGPVTDIHNNVIITSGKGLYSPRGIAPMIAKGDQTRFNIDFTSVAHKRPVRIDYDGYSIEHNDAGQRICGLSVSIDPAKTAHMLVTREPALRTFTAMMG